MTAPLAGATLVDVRRVETRRQRHGANRHLRIDCEFVLALRSPRLRRRGSPRMISPTRPDHRGCPVPS